MMWKTTLFWSLTEQWTSKDATEPSDLYIMNTRIGGGICFLIGLAGIIIFLFD
ncbi:MAG TPA: DUF6199 family natural product biosynthesis protein [Paenibacillus sp.]|uniref:DUF6199 family natural product biosynthesis protein n=2 Tax=Paenibacillus TaxID=44249 RepID=UPI002CE5D2CF|nr:DUF6199 family natural product biosynthesis protein [Paenibacillus sp.]HUC92732.1 DUF6199 family natural product biosynthesis protein [Paenibacillus sp.]